MIEAVAARRYAEAARLLAQENNNEEEWLSGLEALAAFFGGDEARAFVENARVPYDRKESLVREALQDTGEMVLHMALLLLRRRRVALAPDILKAFRELADEAKGIKHAVVTSAVELSDDELNSVKQRLQEMTGGGVVVESKVDGDILGGLVVRIGDRLIDGSTRSRLKDLKRKLQGAH